MVDFGVRRSERGPGASITAVWRSIRGCAHRGVGDCPDGQPASLYRIGRGHRVRIVVEASTYLMPRIHTRPERQRTNPDKWPFTRAI